MINNTEKERRIRRTLSTAILFDRLLAAVILLIVTSDMAIFAMVLMVTCAFDSAYSVPQATKNILQNDRPALKDTVDFSYIGFSVILGCGLFISFGWLIALPITIAIGGLSLYYSPQIVTLMMVYLK